MPSQQRVRSAAATPGAALAKVQDPVKPNIQNAPITSIGSLTCGCCALFDYQDILLSDHQIARAEPFVPKNSYRTSHGIHL